MSVEFAFSNTPTDPVTASRSGYFTPDPINNGVDFRVVNDAPGEVVLSNITDSLRSPESVRIAVSEVSDMFKGTKIEYNPNAVLTKKGCSILIQLNTTALDDSAAIPAYYPYSAHLVLKVPYGPAPTATDVKRCIERLLGHLFSTGEASIDTRISGLIRGATKPTDL